MPIKSPVLPKRKHPVADFSTAIKLNPNDADAYFNRGIALGELKQHEEAMADYKKAISLDPHLAG
jgi:tetratricopeptide (TPR) repeat protein